MTTKPRIRHTTGALKRRPALNVSSQDLKLFQDDPLPTKFSQLPKDNKENHHHVQFFADVQQCLISHSPTTKKKKHTRFKSQKKFQQILNSIEPRSGAFYRFGFKTYEKANKRLFAEVLNVPPNRIKGTMQIGELWSGMETNKFLKENKIYINKSKMIDKLKNAKEKQDHLLLTESTATFIPSSPTDNNITRGSITSRFFLSQPTQRSRLQSKDGSLNEIKELNNSIERIHKQIQSLKPFAVTQRHMEKLKQLEECIERFEEIDNHYHSQMAYYI